MVKQQRVLRLLLSVFLITLFMGCASTQKKESAGEYIDDSAITTKVKAAIFNDSSLKVSQINVETFKGVVQLSGFVDTPQSIARAEEVARSVNGVKDVRNSLIVKPTQPQP